MVVPDKSDGRRQGCSELKGLSSLTPEKAHLSSTLTRDTHLPQIIYLLPWTERISTLVSRTFRTPHFQFRSGLRFCVTNPSPSRFVTRRSPRTLHRHLNFLPQPQGLPSPGAPCPIPGVSGISHVFAEVEGPRPAPGRFQVQTLGVNRRSQRKAPEDLPATEDGRPGLSPDTSHTHPKRSTEARPGLSDRPVHVRRILAGPLNPAPCAVRTGVVGRTT